MKKLKFLSAALLTLSLSGPVFAGPVYVPSQQGGWKVGIDALYLRLANSDLDYATASNLAIDQLVDARNISINPSHNWGFYVQVGYLFPYTGNDITAGYTYLRNLERESVTVGLIPDFGPQPASLAVVPLNTPGLGPFGEGGGVSASTAQGKGEFRLNAFDLEAGQRFTIGVYDMRMFAGVRYANLNHQLIADTVRAFNDEVQLDFLGNQKFATTFRGIGPRIGVDGRYAWRHGFGLDGNLSTALLVGKTDANYLAIGTVNFDDDSQTGQYSADNGSNRRIVPVLEAKLGVDYTRIVNVRQKSSLVFELGYQTVNYFNAIDHARVVSNFQILSQNTTSDLSFNGLYCGVKYYA